MTRQFKISGSEKSGVFGSLIEYVRNPWVSFISSVLLSMTLFIVFYNIQFWLHDAGFDPLFNLLLSSTFGAAALWLVVTTISTNLMFVIDVESFLYFLRGTEYNSSDYDTDISNRLTTYERCLLNQRKKFFYFSLYVFLYWLLVTVYPTEATPIF